MRYAMITAGLTLAAALQTGGAQSLPAAHAGLRDRVQAYMDEWRSAAAFPGAAVGIVLKDGTAIGIATGVSDRATKRPVTTDDLFLAGSTGKTFFAAVAVEQIERGMLDLDAPVSKYLGQRPWFARLPNAKEITVRQLMTHTSGLVRYEMNPKFTAEDTNYIVLGMVLEEIFKRPLYDEVRVRFLQPLQLSRIVPSTSRRIPGLVNGYAGPRDPLGLPDEVMVNGQFVVNPQFEWTGGGYATSPLDLARWGHELYAGKALNPAARQLMIDAAMPDLGVSLAIQINTSAPRSTGTRSLLRGLYDIAAMVKSL